VRTRAIVTSHPDLACFVCGRRLLRGELPEEFFADGQPRTVCELCAPRALREGWPRAHEGQPPSMPALGVRRRRGLLARLRQPAPPPAIPSADPDRELTGSATAGGEPELVQLAPELDAAELCESPLERAIAAFNSGEYPRRVAGLSRSLGAPEVSVRLDEDLGVVSILVAWELCWYRYELDALAHSPQARPAGQGNELAELARGERLANALADERGAISLAALRA